MTTIYRVETREGEGPYRAHIIDMFEDSGIIPEYADDFDLVDGTRKHYAHDGIPSYLNDRQQYYFAFTTPEQLIKWFLPTDKDVAILRDLANMHVVALSVPEAEVFHGYSQCMYLPDNAEIITDFELDDFRTLVV